MPLQKLGGKEYYIGIFFKVRTISLSLNFIFPYSSSSSQANWYKAEQFCRFHNMHLASINSEQEQRELQEHIQSFGEFLSYISLIVLSGRLISWIDVDDSTTRIKTFLYPTNSSFQYFLTIGRVIELECIIIRWTMISMLLPEPYHYRHYLPPQHLSSVFPRISLPFSFISSKECPHRWFPSCWRFVVHGRPRRSYCLLHTRPGGTNTEYQLSCQTPSIATLLLSRLAISEH